jgi:hypothetical protein
MVSVIVEMVLLEFGRQDLICRSRQGDPMAKGLTSGGIEGRILLRPGTATAVRVVRRCGKPPNARYRSCRNGEDTPFRSGSWNAAEVQEGSLEDLRDPIRVHFRAQYAQHPRFFRVISNQLEILNI